MRIFRICGGLLVPHRDYTDIGDSYVRIIIPLAADARVLHSEDSTVYHMRPGEIWFVDTDRVHAACGLNDASRIALCLDFRALNQDVRQKLLPHARVESVNPDLRYRPALGKNQVAAIQSLAHLITHDNFEQVVGLSLIHI